MSLIILADAELDLVTGGILNGGAGGSGGAGGNGGSATTGNGAGGNVSGDCNNFSTPTQTATANGGMGGNGARGGSVRVFARITA